MARHDDQQPDQERLGKITRAIGAIVIAVICFGFRNDVQDWSLRAVLGTLGILALVWGAFPFLKRKR